MSKKFHITRSTKDFLVAIAPALMVFAAAVFIAYKYIDPAPPKHFVISTGTGEGDYNSYAKQYRDIIKDDGVDLEIRPSKGTWENLKRLKDPKSDVEVGFIHDGIGKPEEAPDLSSLGSLYYEPLWVFYKGKADYSRFSQFVGKRIAVGTRGTGTHTLITHLLKESGVTPENARYVEIGDQPAADALKNGEVDIAVFLSTPDDPLIKGMIEEKSYRLMSVDQAEAITKRIPYLHHLVLAHGAMDLQKNLPPHDTDMVSPTATLLVRDSLHPALSYLLLKAASQVHSDPGIFEKKNEFPMDKDYQFPLSDEAKTYYKSGTPFWQRYLPFWLATLIERFILLVIPMIALIIPIFRMIPKIMNWRVRSRFYQKYGELKYLENEIEVNPNQSKLQDYLIRLDGIEKRVNHMKVPLDFSDQIYGLREHINFVRERLRRIMT